MNRGIVVVVLAAALAGGIGCKKSAKAGEGCNKDGATVCKDKTSAFVCAEGKWEEMPCRSVNGCMSMGPGAEDNCTNLTYLPNEPCFTKGVYQCTADGKAMLACETTRWKVVEKCLGMNGCVANAMGAKCDMSISEEGAPCGTEDTYSCTQDGKSMLRCAKGKMVAHAKCPGRHGCRKQFDTIECNGEQLIRK